jgi:hypothetical protein
MYAILVPANAGLERDIAELLTRPVGRPSHKPGGRYKGFLYQAARLEDSTTSSGEGGVPRWKVVSASWLHRHEPEPARSGGYTVL